MGKESSIFGDDDVYKKHNLSAVAQSDAGVNICTRGQEVEVGWCLGLSYRDFRNPGTLPPGALFCPRGVVRFRVHSAETVRLQTGEDVLFEFD